MISFLFIGWVLTIAIAVCITIIVTNTRQRVQESLEVSLYQKISDLDIENKRLKEVEVELEQVKKEKDELIKRITGSESMTPDTHDQACEILGQLFQQNHTYRERMDKMHQMTKRVMDQMLLPPLEDKPKE